MPSLDVSPSITANPPSGAAPRVVIGGCGAITAVGAGVESLRVAMRANLTGLRPCERFNSPRFQSNIAGAVPISHADDNAENPAHYLATVALEEARLNAASFLEKIPFERIGLVLSTTKANIEALERMQAGVPCSDRARRHLQGELLAEDLAKAFKAKGPVQCVSVACISGLVALQQGAKFIQRGDADAVYVVGVDHLSAFVTAGFSALKAIDPIGCRPFDKDRCGLSPGEAGAAVVLINAQFAAADGITLRSWATTNDANHMTGPSRDGSGLAAAVRTALESAGLRPNEIDYVNAHGTGTAYNDAMESEAMRAVFGEACPPFSGAKGMLGHTLGAAGVVETILCVLAMNERLLPGTPRLSSPAQGTPVGLLLEPRPITRLANVLKVNTGFGGVNGALILRHG